ncbi:MULTISPECIES: DUF2537 domain-containing protein [Gordonia]|uniref:DUF2537 domain-containing protein n=1 Tax=Gordonia TaxID=2053 RepID=UPI0021AC1D08|nr:MULTISPECIES: DUF2537 domain-containing protein [Gordonia]MCR8898539.1 DUF2537 domain-containing protein [Gordonia sp. GONU]MCZ4581411.1 DUF2537 domain-containing protein [Gordonia amicalis]MCZ4653569.1 DUF2537 domain-containing protein [Gordonia amicalis]MDJ0455010.1 DUF2537 domain-containing protein [Gordonia amicalis]MDV7078252.1 DUF2537 domain-containing protein [Gordonia amicalis]
MNTPEPFDRNGEPTPWVGHTEPTPWALGIVVSAVCALFGAFVLVGIYELIGGILKFLGIAAVLVVAGGLGWTLWEFRYRLVWRWIVWGLLIGFLAGVTSSIALLIMGR